MTRIRSNAPSHLSTIIWAAFLTLAFQGCAVNSHAETPIASSLSYGEKYEILRAQEARSLEMRNAGKLSEAEAVAVLQAKHEELFLVDQQVENHFQGVSDSDLEIFFQAAWLVAFYGWNDGQVEHMAAILEELGRRGLSKPDHYSRMYEMLVSIRSFEAAGDLLANHPGLDLEALPVIRQQENIVAPSVWVAHPKQRILTRENFKRLDADAGILVVSHPLCPFSNQAGRDILASPELREAFAGHSRWVSPPHTGLHFEAFQAWNRAHPELHTTMVHAQDEWPLLERWGTPTFYFFRDGELRETVVGWPAEGRREEVLNGIRLIGLAD